MTSTIDPKPNDKALFCAACGSADVTTSALAGGDASCGVCGWRGKVEDLAAFRFSHNLGSAEQVFHAFFIDVRTLLSRQFAQEAGKMLIKWGFMDAPDDKNLLEVQKTLMRYIAGIAKAVVESIADTRAKLEKEKHRDAPSA